MATKPTAEKTSLLNIVDGLHDKLSRIDCLRNWAQSSHEENYVDGAYMAVFMMRDYVEDAIKLKDQLNELRKESLGAQA